jgi:hypothetical protein
MTGRHWGEFRREQRSADAAPADEVTAADVCASIFTGASGKDFLRHLYAMTIDKRCRPGASEAELRELEAQRRLVAELERLRDEGLARRQAKAKPAPE